MSRRCMCVSLFVCIMVRFNTCLSSVISVRGKPVYRVLELVVKDYETWGLLVICLTLTFIPHLLCVKNINLQLAIVHLKSCYSLFPWTQREKKKKWNIYKAPKIYFYVRYTLWFHHLVWIFPWAAFKSHLRLHQIHTLCKVDVTGARQQ